MKHSTPLNSDIFYIVFIDEYEEHLPFLYPNNISQRSLDIIKFFPKNIYQMFAPSEFTSLCVNSNNKYPYRVVFIKRNDTIYITSYLTENKNFKILLIDPDNDKHILKIVKDNKIELFYIVNVPPENASFFSEVEAFFINLFNNKGEIFQNLNISDSKLTFSVKINSPLEKEFNYFVPSKNNHLTLNNYLGNFNIDITSNREKVETESQKALKSPYSFQRLDSQLITSRKIDELYEKFDANSNYLPDSFLFAPLILAFPFNNPDVLDFFTNPSRELKNQLSLLRVEQTKNFTHLITINDDDDERQKTLEFATGANLIKNKLSFLDSIAFLISSYNLSPYIRFPVLGKSIYRELSFISPNHFNTFLTQKSQLKLSDTIRKIGGIISEKVISSEVNKYIQKRNSQIITISDLPIEWITMNDIPFGFTHDITRLPETTYNNLLNSYAFNHIFEFNIDEDIINDTLVIMGSNDKEFTKWSSVINDLSEKHGFNFKQCSTVNDFIEVISKHKPKFLIIDAHGGYDADLKETYLLLGEERLTNDIIISNNISIPLVFISACGTAPVYGTFKPIANSFLYMGAKSVTSTYLPIDIDNSTHLYLEILKTLREFSNVGAFNTWLEYICFHIRKSFIERAFSSKKQNITADESDLLQSLITDSLFFNKRKKVYKSTIKFLESIPRKDYNKVKNQIFEFMFYTNMGRGDLVLFSKYREKNGKLN